MKKYVKIDAALVHEINPKKYKKKCSTVGQICIELLQKTFMCDIIRIVEKIPDWERRRKQG